MATIHHKLTNEKPIFCFGGTSLLFDKLVIRTGNIDSIEFQLSWKSKNPLNPFNPPNILNSATFNPFGFINPQLSDSTTFDFRKDHTLPYYNFEQCVGDIELTAFSSDNKPFDLDIHLVVNNFRVLLLNKKAGEDFTRFH